MKQSVEAEDSVPPGNEKCLKKIICKNTMDIVTKYKVPVIREPCIFDWDQFGVKNPIRAALYDRTGKAIY